MERKVDGSAFLGGSFWSCFAAVLFSLGSLVSVIVSMNSEEFGREGNARGDGEFW